VSRKETTCQDEKFNFSSKVELLSVMAHKKPPLLFWRGLGRKKGEQADELSRRRPLEERPEPFAGGF
jgi:hypothetical protein